MMKIKINVLFLLACMIGISVSCAAQDTTGGKIREYYLSFGGFSPLDMHLKYKKQIRERLFFKMGLVSLSARVTQTGNAISFPVKSENYSGGLEFGFEWRKPITRKFTVFHGPALRGIYEVMINRNLNPAVPQAQQVLTAYSLHGSIPYSIGFLYQVYQSFFLSAELTPSLYFSYQAGPQDTQNSYSANAGLGFDNRFGLISLVFRH